jgi:hypothetical protein
MDERCDSKTIPPCSANGTNEYALSRHDCYSFDEGCGYPCVDALLEDESWLEAEEDGHHGHPVDRSMHTFPLIVS